jgi:hypothetical protein
MTRVGDDGGQSIERRHLERISLPRPILIRSGVLGYADSAAVLRDISAVGAYCYTLLPLAKGDVVELFLTVADSIGKSHLSFTGTVVRIEKGVTDNSSGVAVRLSAFNELETCSSGGSTECC